MEYCAGRNGGDVTYTPEVEDVIAKLKAIEEKRRAAFKRRSETSDETERSTIDKEIEGYNQQLSEARRILTDKP
jgi:hypothetical protein